MIRIAGIVLAALIAVILLKKTGREFSLLIVICTVIIIFIIILEDLYSVVDRLTDLTQSVSVVRPYISLMLKVLGISLISQLVSDLCRDSGESALASQAEIAGKIIILVVALPLFESVIEIITGLLK